MAPPFSIVVSWPATHCDPKWEFPRLDLAISTRKAEEDKDKDKDDVAANNWAPPKPTIDPKDFWGSDDKDPPSIDIALVA